MGDWREAEEEIGEVVCSMKVIGPSRLADIARGLGRGWQLG
jgi:hypothetical protein